MKLVYIAMFLASSVASTAQADPLIDIPAGAVIECLPTPSIKWLKERVEFKEGKIASGFIVTCSVPRSQAAPPGSIFVAKLVDGPVTNSYTFQWEMLRFSDGMMFTWSNPGYDYPSTIVGDDGYLKLNFKSRLMAERPDDLE